ncbi:MAG: ABC transporter permease [Bacteroidales bacterium]|jgi:lipoprotein-releasing system permease protein|nr:ABC transporter permease [Bacteroidales bacterium]
MNTERFIARRLMQGNTGNSNYSRPIVKIAVWGISIGLIVMILAVAVLTGFKQEISNKVIGFGSHLQVRNFDNNISYETIPITENQDWIEDALAIPNVHSIQKYITKAGIIQTEDYIQGVVMKGIDNDFSWKFLNDYLIEGDTLTITDTANSNDIVISANIANKLNLKLGDKVKMFFIQEPPRMRRFTIHGIYDTQLEEMDKIFVFCDIKHLRKLNNWEDDQVSGFEVQINDIEHLQDVDLALTRLVGSKYSPDNSVLAVDNVFDQYPQIFDWLSLQDKNMWVILILMLIVAGFNMISGLLIIILERANMIGIMKSIGANNISIQKIFLYHAAFLIGRGLLWGNIIGIGLCILQQQFGIIQLDPSSYYVATVPVNLSFIPILLLNLGTIFITVLMLILPSMLVTRITPAEAIRFD